MHTPEVGFKNQLLVIQRANKWWKPEIHWLKRIGKLRKIVFSTKIISHFSTKCHLSIRKWEFQLLLELSLDAVGYGIGHFCNQHFSSDDSCVGIDCRKEPSWWQCKRAPEDQTFCRNIWTFDELFEINFRKDVIHLPLTF